MKRKVCELTPLILGLALLISSFGEQSALASSSSDKILIRNLFYNSQQAWQNGTASGIAFVEKNDYPGTFNMGSTWQHWKSDSISLNFLEFTSPDLATLVEDPTWVLGAGFCHSAMKSPPKGITYVMSVTNTISAIGTPSHTTNVQVHATILKKRAYFYETICHS